MAGFDYSCQQFSGQATVNLSIYIIYHAFYPHEWMESDIWLTDMINIILLLSGMRSSLFGVMTTTWIEF